MTYKKREFTGSESDNVLANFYMSKELGLTATVLPSGLNTTVLPSGLSATAKIPDCFNMPAPKSSSFMKLYKRFIAALGLSASGCA